MQENELVARAQAGDHDAFEQLVALYEKRVYNLALRMSRNAEDALDLAQEIFIRVYQSLPFFKGQSAFSTWLYSIASNACIDFTRREKRRGGMKTLSLDDEENQAALYALPDLRYQPEDEAARRETREELCRAMEKLSPSHREILTLRELNELSYGEIADALDLTQGTVKSRLCRAREQLCRILTAGGNKSAPYTSNQKKRR